jgi:hypothetical protein
MFQRRAAPESFLNLESVRKAQRAVTNAFDQILQGSDALAVRSRAGVIKDRQRLALEAARLAEGSLDRWSV